MKTLQMPLTQTTISPILNSIQLQIQRGDVNQGIANLIIYLKKTLDAVGEEVFRTEIKEQCLGHPIAKILHEDPCTFRSFSKPEGYAGDAHLIDFMYRLSTFGNSTTYLGRQLFHANISSTSTESVRWRAQHLSSIIEQTYEEKRDKIKVLSVASGRCRELSLVQNPEEKIERFVCLDQDEKSNELVRQNNPHDFLYVHDDSILFLLKNGLGEQKFDFVYSAGLFDYLEKKIAYKLIASLYRNVEEGGQLLIPNFAPGLLEQGYMETFMDWKLIYRTEEEMLELAELAGVPREKVELYRDPMYNVIYMRMEK